MGDHGAQSHGTVSISQPSRQKSLYFWRFFIQRQRIKCRKNGELQMNKSLAKVTSHLLLLFVAISLLTACGSDESSFAGATDNEVQPADQLRSVTLSWHPSPDENVAGYRVYYNSGETTFPIGVFGANEGTSPIDIGEMTTMTLTGLLSHEIYYFTVTSYDRSGNESGFSNIVSTL